MLSSIIITAFICLGLGAAAGYFGQKYFLSKEYKENKELAEIGRAHV